MKNLVVILLSYFVCTLVCGCSVEKIEKEYGGDISFTVLAEEEIPKELKELIEEDKSSVMRETYEDDGWLYLVYGYGEQKCTGYSITIDSCYETSNAIYLYTTLEGPEEDEKVIEKKTYPYVVLKMESRDKHVVFE